MVFLSLKSGFSQLLSAWRIWIIFYLANLFTGMLVILPLRATLRHFIDDSVIGKQLGEAFSWHFFAEFLSQNSSLASLAPSVVLAGIAVYILVNLFLSAGTIQVLVSGKHQSLAAFWSGCSQYFGRFLRAALISVPVILLLVLAPQLLLGAIEYLFLQDAYEYWDYWLNWAAIAVRYFMFVLGVVILDYTRIHIVKNDSRRVIYSWIRAFRFTFLRFRRTLTLAFSYILIGLLVMIFYHTVSNWLPTAGWSAIILMSVFQQMFMIFRMGVRVSQFASEIYLYDLLGGEKNGGESPVNENAVEAIDSQ